MKKIAFYMPVIIFTVIFGLIAIIIRDIRFIISPIVAVWLVLFMISGILLSKNMFWGSLLGALPGIHWIYMGTQYTMQTINEMPIGIVIITFYIISGGFVFYKTKKQMT